MSNSSLVGFDSINVQEYLPILEKIKCDLNLLFEMGFGSKGNATMQFNSNPIEKYLLKHESKSNYNSCHTETGEEGELQQDTLSERELDENQGYQAIHNKLKRKRTELRLRESELINLEISFEEKIIGEYNELKKQNDVVEKKVKQFQSEITSKDKEIEEWKKKCEDSEKRCQDSQDQINKKQLAIDKMEMNITESQTANAKECNNCRLLERKLDNSVIEMKDVERKVDNYRICLDLKYEECEKQRREILRLKEELKNLKPLNFNERGDQSVNTQQGAAAAPPQNTNVAVPPQNKADKSNYRSCHTETDDQGELQQDSLPERESDENQGYQAMHNKLKCKRSELRERANELANLKISCEAMKITINGKTKENEKINGEYNELKKQNDVVEKKVKQFQTEITSKDKEIEEWKNKCEDSVKRCQDSQDQINKKQLAIDKMEMNIKESQTANATECNNCRLLERKLDNSVIEMKDVERKVDNYRLCLELKYAECEQQKKETLKLKEELENLQRLNFNEKGDQPAAGVPPQKKNLAVPLQKKTDKNPYPDWWNKHME